MLSKTERTIVKKGAHKACHDENKLHQIIDESLLAHVGIIELGVPIVIPMLAWRVDDHIYIHGANNSRMLRALKKGVETSLTFTLFDGWVLARSAMHHSAHYRSAMVFGRFEQINENEEKDRILNHFIEQIAPNRTNDVRLGNQKELSATLLLKMPLTEASVKIGNNGVNDDEADLDRAVWAGVMPYKTVIGPLEPVPEIGEHIDTPDYSSAYGDRWCDKSSN
ncbi:pyridoxamine 5'-phosphate oxidase family protein [Vibrio algarum]|uniref:Pyridoxamine 5'-phosphate oxidase family protein n=1 Tax=Vibrio algarum TaxID=3020714 RepID=A0ABT4YR65_9VIBR|nr:pyridoxamine 5'-phosphate oxidase family protein [Vibrio sp. KJ40-1]MDB1123524.1 pyridoxamine 5'-phosphate oxidase family protein [Vibrio sp. KJ40-1]